MKRDNQLAARVLAQWALKHFRPSELSPITDSLQIAERTVWRWKKCLETDSELSVLFEARLNELLNQDWAKTLDLAIGAGISKISELMGTSNSLPEVVEALKALAEIKITREVLAPQAALTKGNPAAETLPHRTLS